MSKSHPIAVITGASSGIGYATAKEFAAHGYRLILIARRKELLDQLSAEICASHPKALVHVFGCDICDWEQVEKVAAVVAKEHGHVNYLINNAGAYAYGPFEKCTLEQIDQLINVNVRGTILMAKAFLPLLKKAAEKKERAKMISVSSIGGLWGFTNMAVYSATKFAVAGLGSALAREWKKHGIQVATIYPGPVNTKVATDKPRERKGLMMFPDEIGIQLRELAESDAEERVSHTAFRALELMNYVSPRSVDWLLKKII